jgi:hypothetical protein
LRFFFDFSGTYLSSTTLGSNELGSPDDFFFCAEAVIKEKQNKMNMAILKNIRQRYASLLAYPIASNSVINDGYGTPCNIACDEGAFSLVSSYDQNKLDWNTEVWPASLEFVACLWLQVLHVYKIRIGPCV